MERYEDKIENALKYLKEPNALSPTGNSPIISLIYKPEDTMEMRSLIDSVLLPKAKYYDMDVHLLSIVDVIEDYISRSKFLSFWNAPILSEKQLYEGIGQAIIKDEVIEKAIMKFQDELADDPRALIVLTHVEMLHPFGKIGVIENKIYTKVHIPVIILYPGEAQGMARSFMGIYNQDGNYRAINF